jgi:ABC-type transporter Mla MlaB component
MVTLLKITTEQGPKSTTLRLEGAIVGPWATEFKQSWNLLEPLLDSKKLYLDMREVTRIDAKGREVLAEMLEKTKAEVQTSSLFIDFCVQEARQLNLTNRNGAAK